MNNFGRNFILYFYSKKGVVRNSFSLSVITKGTVIKYLNKLGANKATSLDGIPAQFIRIVFTTLLNPLIIYVICPLLLVLFQMISSLPVLFHCLKNTEPGNYRQVSILSVVSKVLERIIYDQVDSYLSENNLLYTH
jgi:hypothetical protein